MDVLDRPTVYRARLARAKQLGEAADVTDGLPRAYRATRARDYIREWLRSEPAPTLAHRAELAALLMDGVSDGAV